MFKYTIVIFALIAFAAAKPGLLASAPLAYTAPLVTATSSQVIARNYNGLAAASLVAAPAPLAYSAPLSYAAPYAYSAYSAPLTYAAAPTLW